MRTRTLHSQRAFLPVLFTLLLCMIGMTNALAQTFTVGSLNYSLNDDGVSVTVTGHVDGNQASGELVIPESVELYGISYPVTRIGSAAFQGCNSLIGELVIPNSVVSIGIYAFQNCTGFTSLTIGTGLEWVDTNDSWEEYYDWASAFYNCSGITTLNYNAINCRHMVCWSDSIGGDVSVFASCSSLTILNIGSNVQSIPNNAFLNCSALTGNFNIPNSVTNIGASAFSGCLGITGTLTIPNSVTNIGEAAFANTGITGTLTIGTAVTSVGSNAFQNCTGLTGIIFNATNCTSIGYYYNPEYYFDYYYGNGEYYTDDPYCQFTSAFSGCSNITMLQIGESVQTIPNGAFRDLTSITGSFNIPNSVVTIGDYAFAETNLSGVLTIPENVTSVGFKAFANTGITTINFNATNCTELGYLYWLNSGYNELAYMSAFYGCSGIESLQIGDNVLQIPTGAFKDLQGISGACSLPNSLETIGGYAFDNIGITGVLTIPESVISVGSYAFSKNDITTVNFNATNCTEMGTGWYWSDGVDVAVSTFFSCNNLTTLNIGSGVQTIPNYAFVNCAGLTGNLSLPNSLISIGENAFFGCTGFSGNLVIPNAVETIGNNAFKDCTGLGGTLTIGESATTIHGTAFTNTNFSTMNYNATNCAIGGLVWNQWYDYQYFVNNSFSGMPLLTTLNIGNNVESISQMAFKDCTSLTGTLTLPNSLTTIGDQAFYNCYGFEGIVMGNSVETIGNEAFRNCGGFKGELTLPETLLSVGNNAFASCDEISTINYNAINCTEMGNAQSPVFYDCASVAHINIGANVQSIPNYAFKRCSTVVDMSVAAEVPPTIYSSTFGTVSRNIPVSVPLGSSPAYRTAQYWKEFFHITEDYSSSPYSYHWSVNVHQFGDNMTVTGIIQIDGVEQAVPYLEIGAFCNGECRGRQLLTYYPQVDRYMVFLMLYGEEGDMFTFKLYNHETDEESTAGCAAVVTFEADAILGSFMEPFVFNFSDMQLSPFSQGYNWWSTYIEQDGINGLEMLQESLGSNGTAIRSQASGYTDYYGEEYGWWGSLTSINNESSYRVITSAPCVASMAGVPAVPSEHPITLNQGWTWMGYVPSSAMDINTALDDMEATMGDVVKSQHGYSEYYAGYGWFGSLNTIEPGTGLMYYSSNSNPVTFTYPDGNRGGELKKNITAENNHWVPNVHAYPDNMTVIAVVELGDMELTSDNYELAVFAANGECRGSVRLTYAEPINRHVAFLTISGKDAVELSFRLYDTETNEEYYDAEESLDFVANAIVGEANDLYVVHFRGTTGMDEFANRVKVYPNPVNRGEQFSIGLSGDVTNLVCVEIVNTLGMVEMLHVTSRQTFTAPDVAGVYTLRITEEGKGTVVKKLIVK